MSNCRSCLLLLRHCMLKGRLCKSWCLIRLSWRLIGRHPLKHRVVPDSRELSCKLLVDGMELCESLLKLRRELSLRKDAIPMAMAVPRRMYVVVRWWRCGTITRGGWSLECVWVLVHLLCILQGSGDIGAAMCLLRGNSLLALARVCCGR